MLIFKSNIYEKKGSPFTAKQPVEYYELFDPFNFVKSALQEEMEVIEVLMRQPKEYRNEDTSKFYPNSYKFGSLSILQELLQILMKGLLDKSTWHQMNTYHFCVLYDLLIRYAFNYNEDSAEERIKTLPELQSHLIHFDLFIKDYFFNTVFLMDEDNYNALSPEEKLKRGFTCPCQFGVINGLLPTREEMTLKETKDFPYSIFV
jgi:hypothetical protein